MSFGRIGSHGRGFGKLGAWLGSLIEAPYDVFLNFADAKNSQYIVVMGM